MAPTDRGIDSYYVEQRIGDDGGVELWAHLGPHHEPFRMRDALSGRAMAKLAAVLDIDAMTLAFFVSSEHDRLRAALYDEDRPITDPGLGKVLKDMAEVHAGRPLDSGSSSLTPSTPAAPSGTASP